MTVQIIQTSEAQIMACLWTIRKEFEDEKSFGDFISQHTGIDAKTALRYVVTWDGSLFWRGLRVVLVLPPRAQALSNSGARRPDQYAAQPKHN